MWSDLLDIDWDSLANDFADFGDWGDVAGGGDWEWLADGFADLGDFGGDMGDMVYDTLTGEFVDASTIDPSDLGDLDLSGSGSGPVGEPLGPQNYDWDAASAGETGPGYATPEQIEATTPFNAPSGSGSGWGRALADGLRSLAGMGSGLGRALAGGGAGIPGLVGGGGLPGLMSAPGGGGQAMGGLGGLMEPRMSGLSALSGLGSVSPSGTQGLGSVSPGGVAAQPRLGMEATGPISAALSRLQAAQGDPIAMQGPVDAGRAPVPFTPLQIQLGNGQAPIQAAPAQRLSGLQALMAQRRG